jgi:hypothetical protein
MGTFSVLEEALSSKFEREMFLKGVDQEDNEVIPLNAPSTLVKPIG